MLVLQASLQLLWPGFSYLSRSASFGIVTIAHPRDFVICPKMHRSLPPPRGHHRRTLRATCFSPNPSCALFKAVRGFLKAIGRDPECKVIECAMQLSIPFATPFGLEV